MVDSKKNDALEAEKEYRTTVESAADYIENFDILETITNVGNDEVFTPRKTCDMMLDSLPEEVWHNPNYKWLNPATKNGIFEREIAIRLDIGLKDVIPDTETRRKHILQNMIYAIGQTKFTANVARRTLYYCSQANKKCDGIIADDGHYVNGYAIGNGSWFDTPEGNILTPITNHEFVDSSGKAMSSYISNEAKKKYKCKYCGITGDSKYNDANQRETYAYEFIHYHHLVIGRKLNERFFGGNKNMKFDIIIGNPPYQLNDGGGTGSSAIPIYQKFVDQAKKLNPKYLTMIIPSRWYAGGKGLDDFRNSMLNDKHISKIVDIADSSDCFPNQVIAGGVSFFLWEKDYNGLCTIENRKKNDIISSLRRNLSEYPVFVRDNKAISIINKVLSKKEKTIDNIVYSRNVFNLNSNEIGHKEQKNDDLTLYSLKGVSYINKDKVTDKENLINSYSVMMTKAMSGGNKPSSNGDYLVISNTMRILMPKEVCTETYLCIGKYDNFNEAHNLNNYLKTKFFRFLLLQALSSINISKEKFLFIPILDFKKTWTDKDLYERYGLNNNEIDYIESLIKEMK